MLVRHNIFFQDLNFDTQTQIIESVKNELIKEYFFNPDEAEEEADYYINAHNFVHEYGI